MNQQPILPTFVVQVCLQANNLEQINLHTGLLLGTYEDMELASPSFSSLLNPTILKIH